MIYSVVVMTETGTYLVEHHSQETRGDLPFFSGLYAAINMFSKTFVEDKIESIVIGDGQFIINRHGSLTFIFHVDLGTSKFSIMPKVSRVSHLFLEFYHGMLGELTIAPGMDLFLGFLPRLDRILNEMEEIDPKIILEQFLREDNTVGGILFDLHSNRMLFSKLPAQLEEYRELYTSLITIVFKMLGTVNHQAGGGTTEWLLIRSERYWFCAYQRQNICFLSIFTTAMPFPEIEQTLSGNLQQVIEFIGDYIPD